VILEPAFGLMYYLGFTWGDYMNLPFRYTQWFLRRIEKEIEKSQKNDIPTKAPHHNTADIRSLVGKAKIPQGPARTNR